MAVIRAPAGTGALRAPLAGDVAGKPACAVVGTADDGTGAALVPARLASLCKAAKGAAGLDAEADTLADGFRGKDEGTAAAAVL